MTEQQKSLSDLETDIAKSRERLAATIDELAFRAQPKNIVAEQKRQLRQTLSDRYHSFMGTSPSGSTGPTRVYRQDGTTYTEGGSAVDQAKAKAEDLKRQAQAKADELKRQAEAKAHEVRSTASAKVEDVRGTATAKVDEVRGTASAKVEGLKDRTQSHGQHAADTSGTSPLADLKTRAQVKADQARLKVDEATHDADGELRMDRVATGLAAAGAALIALGVARRNQG